MSEFAQALGLVAGGGVAGGGIVAYILRYTAARWLAAIERMPTEADVADSKAKIAEATHRQDVLTVSAQEHAFQIRALEDRADRARNLGESEHDRLSKHVVEITGDFEVLKSRVLVLEIRMEQRSKTDVGKAE